MDLKRRLARLEDLSARRRPRPATDKVASPAAGAETAAAAGESPEVAAARERVRRSLGLQPRDRAAGPAWCRDYPPDPTVPPPPRLAALPAVLPRAAGEGRRAGDLLFLDLETTGLAGGTGSLAFLVGLGWWQDDGFVVRQVFLPGPGREEPLLAEVAAAAAGRAAVVTYNGDAFDLPLLRTRSLLARRPPSWAGLESWDLLPACRRLWGRRLADCRQQTLEEHVCRLRRGPGDIEGWAIPQTYFAYLRQGEAGLLPNVLEHNRRDLAGMALLLGHVLGRAEQLPHPETGSVPWADAWANGRLCTARRWREPAAGWMLAALEGWRREGENAPPEAARARPAAEPDRRIEALHRDAVLALKRTRRWPDVERVLGWALARLGDRPWAHREAAILFEHRLGRPHDALVHARALGEPARLARLARKLARS